MKQEDFKESLSKIEPNDRTTRRMLQKVLTYKEQRKEESRMNKINIRMVIPALAIVILIAAGIGTNKFMDKTGDSDNFVGNTEDLVNDNSSGEGDLDGIFPEDWVAIIDNQFQIEDKHYYLLSEELRVEFHFPDKVNEYDIGNKITDITTTVDSDLLGCEVYEYLPSGGMAVVAVKINQEYKLFRFYSFESYNNNKDEDTASYLKLYGINTADDIAKIQFLGYSEAAKLEGRRELLSEISDAGNIFEFYNFYSMIKDSSSDYFDQLFNYTSSGNEEIDPVLPTNDEPKINPELTAPDYVPENIGTDMIGTDEIGYGVDAISPDAGDLDTSVSDSDYIFDSGEQGVSNGKTSSSGSAGSSGNALSNSITIRIYNQQGVYYDAEYYPNLSFISRHKVTDEFASFLNDYIK
ncbi:MAG: hypothetical protein K0S76_3123 [Herbinix sp.]|jgi:hypothetical protein|nr:hypothetical protein [Herbinix sp.]